MGQLVWFFAGMAVGSLGLGAALALVAVGADRRRGPARDDGTISLQEWREAS